MYPNLYYAFKDLFNIELPFLYFVNSFGFFVAIAFLTAAWLLYKELERKEQAGLFTPSTKKVIVGKPATPTELIINFIWGFLFGFKIIGLFIADRSVTADPQAFIFSTQGNWLTGFIAAAFFTYMKYAEKKKQVLPQPKEEFRQVWPKDRVGDMLLLAAVFGFLGAKIFHNLENWSEFVANPIESLFSFSGLTFYGGLICAGLAIYFYSRKHKFSFRQLCDAIAPALIIAYAIGRIGCQVSGDGDWGIVNAAYINTPDAKVIKADTATAHAEIAKNLGYYKRHFGVNSVEEVHKRYVTAPSFLPTWMFAYNFPNNVVNDGIPIQGCDEEQYCNQLPLPVFPTAFYETLMGFLIFGILWALRKKILVPGVLFAIYLFLNGLERFLIEKIRVNNKYHILGFEPTQAELISGSLMIAGIVLAVVLWRRRK